MTFLLFLVLGILIFSHLGLRDRVHTLEQELSKRSGREAASRTTPEPAPVPHFNADSSPAPTPAAGSTTTFGTSIPAGPRPVPQAPHLVHSEPAGEFFLYRWFKEQTLIKVGSIIFFFGAVWFVSYAIEQNWISPFLRIVLGLLLAVATYVVGAWRTRIDLVQGQVLTVLGTGIFLGTIIASQFAFAVPVLSAAPAFLLMLISIGYTLAVAIQTKTEWLAVAASVAGLFAPLLINISEPAPTLLLSYLVLLAASFLTVVFATTWRTVTLTLLVGTVLHLATLHSANAVGDGTLWFFVVIFSALFGASTTISLWRTRTPVLLDVSALTLLTLQFVVYATTIAPLGGLMLFIGAAVAAVVGYALYQRRAHADTVSLYVAISLIGNLVGTAELFDGFVLTIAYALEVLAVYLLSLQLATVRRSVYVAAALFLLPVLSGLVLLESPAWETGVLHAEALGTLAVVLTLGFAVIWTLRTEVLRTVAWLRSTAAVLLGAWLLFVMAAIITLGTALEPLVVSAFTNTVLLSLVAGTCIVLVTRYLPYPNWRTGSLLFAIVPTLFALHTLSHPAWSTGIAHQPFSAAVLYFIGLLSLTIFYNRYARKRSVDAMLSANAYLLVWATIGYGIFFLATVWDALLTGDTERVVNAVSFTLLIYLVVNGLLFLRENAHRVWAVLLVLVLPIILLLPSLPLSGWSDGALGVNATGLYVVITILLLLGVTIQQHRSFAPPAEQESLRLMSTVLYGTAGVLIFALVWVLSQTILATQAMAVTVALFLYTVAGLWAYSYGRLREAAAWRRVGILLLTAVVLRLALIDVWSMEPVWRIVTFLGIGLLFIATALLERSHEHRNS